MLDGLDHVWKAAVILGTRDGTLKERLREAAAELAVALVQPDEWPADLLGKGRGLSEKMRGIEQMDPAAASRVAGELLSLAADVHAAFLNQRRG